MRAAFDVLDRKAEYWLNLLLYAYIIVVVFYEVVSRYVLRSSVAWAEETAIYAFIWLSYLSAARLARTRSHLAFTLFRESMGRRMQLTCLLVADLCLIALATVVIVYMLRPISDSIEFGQTMQGAYLPLWIATVAVPIGWALVLLRTVQRALDAIRNYRDGKPMAEHSLTGT
jgi:TRAP-type C4-dicarboxylate transport system permease small subunit